MCELHRLAALHDARVGRALAGEHVEQGRLARPVDADEREAITRTEPPSQLAEKAALVERHVDIDRVDHTIAEPRAGEALELDAVASGRLVGDERVRRLDPELRLRRTRR